MELPEPPPPSSRQTRTRPWLVSLLIAGLVAATAAGILVTRDRSDGPPIDLTSLRGTILFATARNETHRVTCHFPSTCNYDVYLVDADGSDVRPLLDGPTPEFAGALSADGEHAVVPRVVRDGRRSALIEVDILTGRTHVLLSSRHSITWPQFSPDGQTIVFGRQLPDDGAALFLMDLRSGSVRRLTQTGSTGDVFIDGYATWSPDGRSIAFIRISDAGREDGQVLAIDVETDTYRPLFELEDPSSLAWSPDGTNIACSAKAGDSHEVFLLPASGDGQPTAITHDSGYDSLPAWSPDGAYLVFTSNRSGTNDLFVMRADGSGVTAFPTSGAPNGGSSWSVSA